MYAVGAALFVKFQKSCIKFILAFAPVHHFFNIFFQNRLIFSFLLITNCCSFGDFTCLKYAL